MDQRLDHRFVDIRDAALLAVAGALSRCLWPPRWDFATTVEHTVGWCLQVQEGPASALASFLSDLESYVEAHAR